jgi:hypothetical protein
VLVAGPHLFSSISLSALAGRWITSPAAIRCTTASGSCRIGCGVGAGTRCACCGAAAPMAALMQVAGPGLTAKVKVLRDVQIDIMFFSVCWPDHI